jgi:hypothetical protein
MMDRRNFVAALSLLPFGFFPKRHDSRICYAKTPVVLGRDYSTLMKSMELPFQFRLADQFRYNGFELEKRCSFDTIRGCYVEVSMDIVAKYARVDRTDVIGRVITVLVERTFDKFRHLNFYDGTKTLYHFVLEEDKTLTTADRLHFKVRVKFGFENKGV